MVSSGAIAQRRDAAREYDIYAPQIAAEYGGMGGRSTILPVFEEAGRNHLSTAAMRVYGADEGNRRIIVRDAFADVNREELEPLTRFGDPNTRRGGGH